MPFLQSCCRCMTLRRGSILSAFYSIIYFAVFASFTAPVVFHDTFVGLNLDAWVYPNNYDGNNSIVVNGIKSPLTLDDENEKLSALDSPVTHPFPTIFQSDILLDDLPPDESFRNPVVYLLSVVDFITELLGCISSLVLLMGLFFDRPPLLIPWLIIIPVHTVVDTFVVIVIVIDHFEDKLASPWEIAMRNIPLLLMDITLNAFNVYMILCVMSQYQEYKMGRGTAVYETYVREQIKEDHRDHCMMTAIVNQSNGSRLSQVSTNRQRSSQKSEICMENEVAEKIDARIEVEESGKTRIDDATRKEVPAVRIKCLVEGQRNGAKRGVRIVSPSDEASDADDIAGRRRSNTISGVGQILFRCETPIIEDGRNLKIPSNLLSPDICYGLSRYGPYSNMYLKPEKLNNNSKRSSTPHLSNSSIGNEDSTVETITEC